MSVRGNTDPRVVVTCLAAFRQSELKKVVHGTQETGLF